MEQGGLGKVQVVEGGCSQRALERNGEAAITKGGYRRAEAAVMSKGSFVLIM